MQISEREKLWDRFLQRWPLEALHEITLRDYTLAGDADCFTYGWLEQTTENLGSIWGGSAFKFGIYSRKNHIEKSSGAGRSYSSEYGWYSKYGTTAEEAFERVRTIFVAIANAARTGNLDAIQLEDLGPAIKWKIAFLYQDRDAPSILPVYSAEHLAAYLGQESKRNIAKLQEVVMNQRGEINVFSFGQKVWEQSQEKLSATALKPADVLAFFQEYPERFQPIKSPSKYIAGFTTVDGRNLAITRELKEAQLWLEPGAWLDDVKAQMKDIDLYKSDRPRNSNLSANAPKLAQGNPAVCLTVPTLATLLALCDAYDNADIFESKPMSTDTRIPSSANAPLNQILYGPPGTGKTFSTIDETLRILDPGFLSKHQGDRKALKAQFDHYALSEHVRFVTFHQSFSYEDFVEGLRAISNDEKQLEYVIEPGVFKRLCDDARTQGAQPGAGIRSNPRIWKISINGTGSSPTQSYCLGNGEARIGWGDTGDLREPFTANSYYNGIGSGDRGTLRYFSEEIVPGDILLCIHSAEMIGAVGVVTGDYQYDDTAHQGVREDYQHVRPVNWLYRNLQLPIAPLNDGKQFTLKTVYSMDRFSWGDLLAYLEKSGAVPAQPSVTATERTPHVLIIDEINRGNISRIFGELITLIEPSKRADSDEALSVTLPYSKKPFTVPSNVYLIGTMNTADR
jgi:5-methylcytosine-specific restriction protein B